MAGPALHRRRGTRQTPVETLFRRNVRSDILVAREAELRLAAAVALVVTIGAVLLVLGVT